MGIIKNTRRRYNLILFTFSSTYIFVLGLFDGFLQMHFVYYTVISAIYIASIFTIRGSGHRFFYVSAVVVIVTWVTELLELPILSTIAGLLSTASFLMVIVMLITRVARSKAVGPLEFLESINVYLLLGIAASVLFGVIHAHDNNAFNTSGEPINGHADFIYFSFVTMTTLGYGDITPNDSLARSLTIFFSVAGQLYLTMIIALLVGKFLSQKTNKNSQQ